MYLIYYLHLKGDDYELMVDPRASRRDSQASQGSSSQPAPKADPRLQQTRKALLTKVG